MHILVTGGSGFIGSNLATRLVGLGHHVWATSGGGGNTPKGNILYRGQYGLNWSMLPDRIDAVFHQSANNDTLCKDHRQMISVNVEDTLTLFNSLYEYHDCRRFIYASSTAVYGASPAPYVEGETPVRPLNVYGESKAEMEEEIGQTAELFKDAVFIGFRYCNVYGPGEEYKGRRASMIHQMIRHKLMGRKVKLFKDGTQARDWVHVEDVVDANILALTHDYNDIFNLGSGKAVSFGALASYIGNDVEWIDCPFADKYQNLTCCGLDKITNRLGYTPKRFVEESIPGYMEYLSRV